MEPQITNDKPLKIKDPKKVEQGIRLGLISKEAKRKKSERLAEVEANESSHTQSDDGCNYWYLVGLFGVTTAFGVYFKMRSTVTTETPETSTSKPKKTKGLLMESFD